MRTLRISMKWLVMYGLLSARIAFADPTPASTYFTIIPSAHGHWFLPEPGYGKRGTLYDTYSSGESAQIYRNLVNALRSSAGHPWTPYQASCHGQCAITPGLVETAEKGGVVELRASSVTRLFFDATTLELLGFSADDPFSNYITDPNDTYGKYPLYEFLGSNLTTRIAGSSPSVVLPFTNEYSALERAAGTGRSDLHYTLSNFLTSMSHLGACAQGNCVPDSDLAINLMVVMAYLQEAARFKEIQASLSDRIANNDRTTQLDQSYIDLESYWNVISTFAQNAAAGTQPVPQVIPGQHGDRLLVGLSTQYPVGDRSAIDGGLVFAAEAGLMFATPTIAMAFDDAYCAQSLLGFDGWRLPNVAELIALRSNIGAPQLISQGWPLGDNHTFWSSETSNGLQLNVDLQAGGITYTSSRDHQNHISCVRPIPPSVYVSDLVSVVAYTPGPVIDSNLGLIYSTPTPGQSYDASYCASISYRGLSNWITPTRTQLANLRAAFPNGQLANYGWPLADQHTYWSQDAYLTTLRWSVDLSAGGADYYSTNDFQNHISCVRTLP